MSSYALWNYFTDTSLLQEEDTLTCIFNRLIFVCTCSFSLEIHATNSILKSRANGRGKHIFQTICWALGFPLNWNTMFFSFLYNASSFLNINIVPALLPFFPEISSFKNYFWFWFPEWKSLFTFHPIQLDWKEYRCSHAMNETIFDQFYTNILGSLAICGE